MTRREGTRYSISQVLERIFEDDLDEEVDGESDSETEDIENDETVEDIDASQAGTSTRHVQSLHDDTPSGSDETSSEDAAPPAKRRKTSGKAKPTRADMPTRAQGARRGRGAGTARQAARQQQDAVRQRYAADKWVDAIEKAPIKEFSITHPGPTKRFPNANDNNASDYFNLFFTDDIWELFVQETNIYHEQGVLSEPTKHKRAWEDVTIPEMKCFIAILLVMGVVKLPRLHLYWSSDKYLHQSGIAATFPRIRFEQIWRYFHLADNAKAPPRNAPEFDKIYRVRTFLNLLSANCVRNFTLGKNMTIDETMIAYKGRLSYKQYMKAKPTKWGIKVWVLSESPSGYIYKFNIYLGKSVTDDATGGKLSHRVVNKLVEDVTDRNHHLYMDNYYTDPELFEILLSKGVYACGTIRKDRIGFPEALKVAKREERRLARGAYAWRANGELLASRWFDKRPVYFLSTIHLPYADMQTKELSFIVRHNPDGSEVEVPCPPHVCNYQAHMRAVDHGDQMITLMNSARRSKKAWKKIFSYGVELAKFNAFLIEDFFQTHYRVGHKDRDYLEFTMDLVHNLVKSQSFRKKMGRRVSLPLSATDELRMNEKYHSIGHLQRRLDCVVCSKRQREQKLSRNERYKTMHSCATCHDTPLCINKDRNCFDRWHTLRIYWN